MANLTDIADLPPFDPWGEGVRARKVQGERVTLAVVELASGAVVPEHRHVHEQLGICIRGLVRVALDGEVRELGPGGTWRILSNRPHEVVAGADGAIVIDVFSPIRDDWAYQLLEPQPPAWPSQG